MTNPPPPSPWVAPPPGPWATPPAPWAVPAQPRPLFAGRFWRRARLGAGPRVLVGVPAVGVLAGLILFAPVGVQWTVLAAAVTVVVRWAAPRALGSLGRADRALLGLILALVAVGAVRTSVSVFMLCLLAALGLGTLLGVRARSWPAVLLTPVVGPLNALRCLPWTVRGLRTVRVPSVSASVVRGLVVAGALAAVSLGLLASADSAFAGLFTVFEVDHAPATLIPRGIIGGFTAALTLALAFNAAVPPRWRVMRVQRRVRPAVEWLIPLIAVDVILTVFIVVQAAVLFGAYPDELVTGDATPAERARQGFGQLVVLTLVVAGLLTWAARLCDDTSARQRRLLTMGGGTLLVLVLVVVASALRRLWLYAQDFGWTVLRLEVVAFEIWLAMVIVGTAAVWATRRTVLLTRLVPASAGVVLLVLALAGPDALVASWNVDRYQRTDQIDAYYLRTLSDDAVPALSRLPRPLLTCVLADRDPSAPWYAANISRLRARRVLDSLGDLRSPDREYGCWATESNR